MMASVDLIFPVGGTAIARDHGYRLYAALSRLLPERRWCGESRSAQDRPTESLGRGAGAGYSVRLGGPGVAAGRGMAAAARGGRVARLALLGLPVPPPRPDRR